MSIKGISDEKCTGCGRCVKDCTRLNFTIEEKKKKAVFTSLRCLGCGHCIAVCPEDAIIYENMKDEALSFEGIQDLSSLISYENLYRLMRAKRSIRQYKKKKIPKEDIEKIIDCMSYAATGGNMRSMKCVVISDDERLNKLEEACVTELNKSIDENYKESFKKKKKLGIKPIFFEAPHVLILYSRNTTEYVNAAIAITSGMLCAETLGVGSCWIGLAHGALNANQELRENLAGIKGNVLGVMTMGYPAVKYSRTPPRPPLKTKWL